MKMKGLPFYIIIIAIISSALLFSACNSGQTISEQSVLIDQTEDTFLVKPDQSHHKNLFELKDDLWSGKRFRVIAINDVDFNPVFQAEILPACEYLSNYYKRKRELTNFYVEVDSALGKVLENSAGKTSSSIYIPLTMELNRLFQSKADEKTLVIYSDLMEHTSLISFYEKAVLKLMNTNPDSLRKILEQEGNLPDLSSIQIHIVYQPRDANESAVFRQVADFYQDWFESKGAKVNIGANLIGQ